MSVHTDQVINCARRLEERGGSNVVLSQIAEVPVTLRRTEETVVVVLGGILGTNLGRRDRASQEDSVDLICAAGAALVKSQDDQGAGDVEVRVGQQRRQEVAGPRSRNRDRRVVSVVGYTSWSDETGTSVMSGRERTHVGSDEHPLRQLVGSQVFVEHGKVL
jgi:hypothetical protein